jgi:hypothetical protein
LSPLSEGDVRLLFRNSSRLESRNSPFWEVLTVPRQDLECRSFGEPVLCKTNTRTSCLKDTPRAETKGRAADWQVRGKEANTGRRNRVTAHRRC